MGTARVTPKCQLAGRSQRELVHLEVFVEAGAGVETIHDPNVKHLTFVMSFS